MNNLIHIYYIRQAEKLSEEVFQQFLFQLPNAMQQDIANYKHWQSAQASLLGKIILQYGFRQLQINHSLEELKTTEKGRPFINSEIDFNISHSGAFIICAIATKNKVGIDIEKHRILKQDIAEKYFTQEEQTFIAHSQNPTSAFFDLWAIKESAIKCDGRGVEILKETSILLPVSSQGYVKCLAAPFYYTQLQISEGYSTAVSSPAVFEVAVAQLLLTDLG
ncbi:MAG: 4'-phosphopantetheinyl transferase superfamily protein [Chitinophagales bacterium]